MRYRVPSALAFTLALGCGGAEEDPDGMGGVDGGLDSGETGGSTEAGSETDASGTETGDGDGDSGDGDGDGDGDSGDGDGDGAACSVIPVTYRDLQPLHVDFGCHMWGVGPRPGLVQDTLDLDNTPIFNGTPPAPPPGWSGSSPQITDSSSFAEWFHDVPGTNMTVPGEIELEETSPGSGVWSFSSDAFFPLTDQGFGNSTMPNWAGETYPDVNGSFTTEIHVNFVYEAGQTFTFIGDDDVWVFIDGALTVDLGGLHGEVTGSVDLDTLGLTAGQTYAMDVFHAERCGAGSHFRIDTSIRCFVPPG